MFKITGGKGFHIEFENGYNVSVQFGAGNYCSNHSFDYDKSQEVAAKGSNTAEVAVWAKDGEMIAHKSFDGDTVGGYKSPADVLKLLNWAARQKGGK
jgi:hypothetical protein